MFCGRVYNIHHTHYLGEGVHKLPTQVRQVNQLFCLSHSIVAQVASEAHFREEKLCFQGRCLCKGCLVHLPHFRQNFIAATTLPSNSWAQHPTSEPWQGLYPAPGSPWYLPGPTGSCLTQQGQIKLMGVLWKYRFQHALSNKLINELSKI